jgi:hypothetical protein
MRHENLTDVLTSTGILNRKASAPCFAPEREAAPTFSPRRIAQPGFLPVVWAFRPFVGRKRASPGLVK